MGVVERVPLPSEARTLPARYYTDPGWFALELERVFFGSWICAGRAESLREPGDCFLTELGDESVLVTRDAAGGLAGFYNVCRHRGTRLCTEETRLPGHIRCPYHGWTYGLDGALLGAPHMEGTRGFRREDHPLRRVAVGEWDGHVFVSFAERPGPLADQLDGLPERFRPWGMGELRRGARRVYEVDANWKLVLQNYSECLHCPVAHPLLSRCSHYLSGDNEAPRRTWLGGSMQLRDGVASLTLDGTTRRRLLPGLDERQRRHVLYYAVLPNLLLNLHPDYVLTFTLWPRACDRTAIVCEWLFHPEEMSRPGFDPSDAVEFWDRTNREDWELSDRAQAGIRSRAYAPGPYSNREELLWALDRLILEVEAAG